MDLSFRFDLWWFGLRRSPREKGHVVALVIRPAMGERKELDAIEVNPEQGVVGDRWSADPDTMRGSQVSLINTHVIRSLARGHAPAAAAGDNLEVDLCLSEENLPPGTRLEIGDAVLEVSREPHRPCAKFVERYGPTAAKKVARANRCGRRGRGLMTSVLRAGVIRVGDPIVVRRLIETPERAEATAPGLASAGT